MFEHSSSKGSRRVPEASANQGKSGTGSPPCLPRPAQEPAQASHTHLSAQHIGRHARTIRWWGIND